MDENISIVEMSLDQVLDGIRDGRIRDSKTIVAVLYYLFFIEDRDV